LAVAQRRTRYQVSAPVFVEGYIEDKFGVGLNELQRKTLQVAVEHPDKNIIIAAPTGAGKTLAGLAVMLADCYMNKWTDCSGGWYLAPLTAIMMQKYRSFQRLSDDFEIIMANRDFKTGAASLLGPGRKIRIISPYKYNSLYRRIVDPLGQGYTVIFDEIHKLGSDPDIESAVSRAVSRGHRVVGLSATIDDEDLEKLAEWMDAVVIRQGERPVKLRHYAVPLDRAFGAYMPRWAVDIAIEGIPLRLLTANESFSRRTEVAATMAARAWHEGKIPVMVYAPTRRMVEQIAAVATRLLRIAGEETIDFEVPGTSPAERLLNDTGKYRVFFYHGGLGGEARRRALEAYEKYGGILVGASGISHGVDTQASLLIITTLQRHDRTGFIDASLYHQIAGRAGRPGKAGEGVVLTLVADPKEEEHYKEIVKKRAEKLNPRLLDSPATALKYAIPEAYYAGAGAAEEALRNTFSYHYYRSEVAEKAVQEIARAAAQTVNFYASKLAPEELGVVAEMGLVPEEYVAIHAATTKPYKEMLGIAVPAIASLLGFPHSQLATIWREISRFGVLATSLGSWQSRDVASRLQDVLDSAVYFAYRVYGRASPQYRNARENALAFAFAGNPRLVAVARLVRTDELRRMVKAVPGLSAGAGSIDEARRLVEAALEAAFPPMWKGPKRRHLRKIVEALYYAVLGEAVPRNVVEETVEAFYGRRRA